MATVEEVKKLAALARVTIDDAELEKFTGEFDAILAYVGQLESLQIPDFGLRTPELRNVMREDDEPHATGAYTDKLVAQFPVSENNALVTKKIINHDEVE